VRGSRDGRTPGMFGEALMVELWDGVGTTAMARTHKAHEGMKSGGETSVGELRAR
jgi:hypothetical protein